MTQSRLFWVFCLLCLAGFGGLGFAQNAQAQDTAQDQALREFARSLDGLAASQGMQLVSPQDPSRATLESVLEQALAITDRAEAWQAPARRQAAGLLYGLGLYALEAGADHASERLLLRGRALLPEGEESIRRDGRLRAQLFMAFGTLYLHRRAWQEAGFWLHQAERQVQEVGLAEDADRLGYDLRHQQALLLLYQAEEQAESAIAEDAVATTEQAQATAQEALEAFTALYGLYAAYEGNARQGAKETATEETTFVQIETRRLLETRDGTARAAALVAQLQDQVGEDSSQARRQAQTLWNQTLRAVADGVAVAPGLHASALEGLATIAASLGQLRDGLAAVDLALELRRASRPTSGQNPSQDAVLAQVKTLELRGQLLFASRNFVAAAEDFKQAEAMLLALWRGATLASAEQAYRVALADLRNAELESAAVSAHPQAAESARHSVAVAETLLQAGQAGGQNLRTEIQPSPRLLRTPLSQAQLRRLQVLSVQSRTLLGISLMHQGLDELARAALEAAWQAGAHPAACGRVAPAFEAAATQALLLAEMNQQHKARHWAEEAQSLLICHKGADAQAVQTLKRRLAHILP